MRREVPLVILLGLSISGCGTVDTVPDFVRQQCGFGPSQTEATSTRKLIAGGKAEVGPFSLRNEGGYLGVSVRGIDWVRVDGQANFQPITENRPIWPIDLDPKPPYRMNIGTGKVFVALKDANPWAYTISLMGPTDEVQLKNNVVRVTVVADCRTLSH